MIKLRTDEASAKQPQFARVANKDNGYLVRIYVNHRTGEREIETGEDKTVSQVFIADFIETVSESLNPLEIAKKFVSEAIAAYDSSREVNEFFIGGKSMWLDKATRSGLKLRLDAERTSGKEETVLWYGTEAVDLKVAEAISMLNALEIYASGCYDRTQAHLKAVQDLNDVSKILNYKFEMGYPDKLNF